MIIANNKYWKQLTFFLVGLHKYYRLNLRKLYAGRVTDIGAENEIGEMSSDSSLSFCVHFHTNFLEKVMDPSLLDTLSSKVEWVIWQRIYEKENFGSKTVAKVTRNCSTVFPKKSLQFAETEFVESYDRLIPEEAHI